MPSLHPMRIAPALVALLFLILPTARADDLLEMSEKLDQLDRLELEEALGKADRCTRARNFSCTETELRQARKYAHSARDRNDIQRVTLALAAERKRFQDEEDELAEQERQLALAEARAQREMERAQAEAEQNAGPSLGEAFVIAGMHGLQTYQQNRAAQRSAELAANQRYAQMQADLRAANQRQQERFAAERERIAAARSGMQRPVTETPRSTPPTRSAAAPSTGTGSAPGTTASTGSSSPNTTAASAGTTNDEALRRGLQLAGIPPGALTRDTPAQAGTTQRDAAAPRAAQPADPARRDAAATPPQDAAPAARTEAPRYVFQWPGSLNSDPLHATEADARAEVALLAERARRGETEPLKIHRGLILAAVSYEWVKTGPTSCKESQYGAKTVWRCWAETEYRVVSLQPRPVDSGPVTSAGGVTR